ncbi:uncharacterized protein LOC136094556 [Hydra vulgaris]|uniref:uncharacterized protein LOC136094556 n=1 Tax=Hydra vulgaris TaxID=6087 RepID=UPI0032EA419E
MAITKVVSRNKMWQKKTPETIVIEDEQELEFHPIDLTMDEFMETLNEKTQNEANIEIKEIESPKKNTDFKANETKKVYILLTKKIMESIYDDVNKAIYKYGKPVINNIEYVKPYEAIFVDGNSVFNLKNIDVFDEKEDYEMMEIDDEDYDEDDEDDENYYENDVENVVENDDENDYVENNNAKDIIYDNDDWI